MRLVLAKPPAVDLLPTTPRSNRVHAISGQSPVFDTENTRELASPACRVRSLSIVHITAPGTVGGLERVVRALAAGHRRLGHDVRVVASVSDVEHAREFLDSVAAAGVEVIPFELPGRAYLRECRALAAICRQHRPDVVHTHGYRPDVVDATVARALGIATVTTIHGPNGGDLKNQLYERLQRLCLRRFSAVVAVSEPLAQSLAASGVRADRLHLVPNAYEDSGTLLDRPAARRALSIPDDTFAIGWIGRLTEEKGPDVMLAAVQHLGDGPFTLSMIGGGGARAELEARARALGAASRTTWHGIVRDAGRLLRAFDVFVLSSRTEGTPIVLLEAMAAGVPVVATRVGGVPHVVSSAEAVLVPPMDPTALASAIRSVYENPLSARQRASAAGTKLARFSLTPWLRRYEEIYSLVRRQHSVSS